MTKNINIILEEELNNALQEYAKAEHKTITNVILEAIIEKLEDYDYKLALAAHKSVDMNDTTTLKDICTNAGINYDSL